MKNNMKFEINICHWKQVPEHGVYQLKNVQTSCLIEISFTQQLT